MDLQITKLHSLPLPCALAFYFSRFSFYVAISSVVILTFLFFCARPSARTISNRWPDHSLSFHYLYLYKYIYKNTADDISALWTRHRRYRFILWVFLCGSGISVSSVRIRLHCKHGSIQPAKAFMGTDESSSSRAESSAVSPVSFSVVSKIREDALGFLTLPSGFSSIAART